MTRRGIAGTELSATRIGEEILNRTDSALAAVVGAYFGAAGERPGVLLGAVSVISAGVARGPRSFDGRHTQPGLGAKRPRGFEEGSEIPEGAWLAVPRGPAACLVALAYGGAPPLRQVVKNGIAEAKRVGADGRRQLLDTLSREGAHALTSTGFVRPLIHVGGPSEGGLLTEADFAPADEMDRPLELGRGDSEPGPGGSEQRYRVPWADDPAPSPPWTMSYLAAVDTHGGFAALGFSWCESGTEIDAGQLLMGPCAEPVRRGVPRVAPGARVPCTAPLQILARAGVFTDEIAGPADAVHVGLHCDPVGRAVTRV